MKFLFTTSRLSVQVHPKDDYAKRHHAALGKTETWYVIDAEPDAAVALGLKQQLSPSNFALPPKAAKSSIISTGGRSPRATSCMYRREPYTLSARD